MKITEDTTLREFRRMLRELDDPLVTVMMVSGQRYSVIAYLQGPGPVSGLGNTLAEALADALTKLDAVLRRIGGN